MTTPKRTLKFEELESLANHFEQRRALAAKRLDGSIKKGWYFGLMGFECEVPVFDFGRDSLVLEKVEEPPGEVELARSLVHSTQFSAIARYSHGITHQLRVDVEAGDPQACFNIAWWVISLIRVRSLAEFLVPVASDHSWSVIAGIESNTCDVHFVEDVPHAKRLAKPSRVAEADLTWVRAHLNTFASLLENPGFRLAVDCLTTHQHQTSDRMMAAMLWSGIESLFAIQAELSFRLSVFIASLLEPPGADRRDLYTRVKKLYAVRSKAVHGAKVSGQHLYEHIVEVRHLLSRLLCRMIEKGSVFSEQEIENSMFGVSE